MDIHQHLLLPLDICKQLLPSLPKSPTPVRNSECSIKGYFFRWHSIQLMTYNVKINCWEDADVTSLGGGSSLGRENS